MRKKRLAYLYVAPLTAFILLIVFLSISESIKQSFGIFEAIGMNEFTLKYYREVLSGEEFKNSFIFCLRYSLISSAISVILGTVTAIYIKRNNDNFSYSVLRLSIIIPHMVVGFIIFGMLSKTGLISRILYSLGLINSMDQFPNLIYDGAGVSLIISFVYKEFCFIAFTLVAVLKRIKDEYRDQSYVLGANKIKTFFYVTLPMILPNILYSFIVIFSFSFSSYELSNILGPSTPKSLATIAYNYYTSPLLTDRPYAMVYNSILLLVGLIAFIIFVLVYRKVVIKEATYE